MVAMDSVLVWKRTTYQPRADPKTSHGAGLRSDILPLLSWSQKLPLLLSGHLWQRIVRAAIYSVWDQMHCMLAHLPCRDLILYRYHLVGKTFPCQTLRAWPHACICRA